MYVPRKLLAVGALVTSLCLAQTTTAGTKSPPAAPRVAPKPQVASKATVSPQIAKLPKKLPVHPQVNSPHLLTEKVPEVAGARTGAFDQIAARAGTIRAGDAAKVLGANSSTLRALEKVMPGFQDRAKGASSLKDLGTSSGGSNRNPVTSATSMSNFIGAGSEKYSDDGLFRMSRFKDGSTVTHVGNNDGHDTVTTKIPGVGTLQINPDNSRTYTLDNGKTIYYDKDGNKVAEVTMGDATVTSGKGGTGGKTDPKKETTPDDETSSSGPLFVTAGQLRGLAARKNSAGTPTGEETSSGGGSLDRSKTDKKGQLSQPAATDDAATHAAVVDAVQINQVGRIKERLILRIKDQVGN